MCKYGGTLAWLHCRHTPRHADLY